MEDVVSTGGLVTVHCIDGNCNRNPRPDASYEGYDTPILNGLRSVCSLPASGCVEYGALII